MRESFDAIKVKLEGLRQLDASRRAIIQQYREFARAVLEEDSGLAVWEDTRFNLVVALAQKDEEHRLNEDDDGTTAPETS